MFALHPESYVHQLSSVTLFVTLMAFVSLLLTYSAVMSTDAVYNSKIEPTQRLRYGLLLVPQCLLMAEIGWILLMFGFQSFWDSMSIVSAGFPTLVCWFVRSMVLLALGSPLLTAVCWYVIYYWPATLAKKIRDRNVYLQTYPLRHNRRVTMMVLRNPSTGTKELVPTTIWHA